MADEKTLKPKSFRITDETAEAFKKISGEIGGNQQEALAKLIEAYEFQQGKAVLTEKKADIEQFEKHITVLTRMYMNSLEDNQNVTETVRSEFEAQLHSKDVTVMELQTQLSQAKETKKEYSARLNGTVAENERLNGYIESLKAEFESKIDDMQTMLTDKENLNKALTDACNSLKSKVTELEALTAEIGDIRSNLADLTAERDKLISNMTETEKSLKTANTRYERDVADLKQHEADALDRCREQLTLQHDKELFEVQQQYQTEIQQLKEKKQQEIDKYQQKYFDLLERINSVHSTEGKNV